MTAEYEQKVIERFPNLDYAEFKAVDNRMERFVIDDLSYKNPACRSRFREAIELFVLACKGYVNAYTAEELTLPVNRRLEGLLERLDPSRTILIFPGNGAKSAKDLLPKPVLESFSSLDIDVCRKVLRDMSIAGVDILTPLGSIRKLLPKKPESCVIIDDVVSSRATTYAIKATIDAEEDFDWYAASWMTLSPLQVRGKKEDKFGSGIVGFRKTITSLVYQGESGTPSNNSLSSFIGTDEKSKAVIAKYKEKYVEDEEVFDQAVDIIRRLSDG